jgi:hypothetical protein
LANEFAKQLREKKFLGGISTSTRILADSKHDNRVIVSHHYGSTIIHPEEKSVVVPYNLADSDKLYQENKHRGFEDLEYLINNNEGLCFVQALIGGEESPRDIVQTMGYIAQEKKEKIKINYYNTEFSRKYYPNPCVEILYRSCFELNARRNPNTADFWNSRTSFSCILSRQYPEVLTKVAKMARVYNKR